MTNDLTKYILREIKEDIKSATIKGLKNIAKNTIDTGFLLSYPILGNMSENLQTRLEEFVGEEHYNSNDASKTSLYTNWILQFPTISYLGYKTGFFLLEKDSLSAKEIEGEKILFISGSIALGMLYSIIEDKVRHDEIYHKKGAEDRGLCSWDEKDHKAFGSVTGKIVSLPFDYLTYTYDATKNYLQEVRKKAEWQIKRDSKENLGGRK